MARVRCLNCNTDAQPTDTACTKCGGSNLYAEGSEPAWYQKPVEPDAKAKPTRRSKDKPEAQGDGDGGNGGA